MTTSDPSFVSYEEAYDRFHAANDQLENHHDEHTPSERRILRAERAEMRRILDKGQGAEAGFLFGLALAIEGMAGEEQWFTVEEGNAVRKAAAIMRSKALDSERRHRGIGES